MATAQPRSNAATTRAQLLDAAEALFLADGVDAVSLRAIVRSAGQRNQSALQYHFGGREGLLAALVARRLAQLDARRADLLAAAGAAPASVRDACTILVGGLFALCREDQDFRQFIGRLGQAVLQTNEALMPDAAPGGATARLHTCLQAALGHLDRQVLALRVEHTNGMALLAVSRRARLGGSFRGPRAALFQATLLDQVVASLSAPISDETRALLGS